MGMEQGGYTEGYGDVTYELGGGGGGYDAGYDAITYDFSGGDGFAVDYADFYGGGDIGPGTISPSGDAIAWGGDDFNYDYGAGFEPGSSGEIPYAPYEPGELNPPTLEPFPEPSFGSSGLDLFYDYFAYYTDLGYDLNTATDLALQDAEAGSITIPTYEQAPLPETSLPNYPLTSFYDYWQSPPYVPVFPDLPAPPPPVTPTPTPPRLPGYCPAGQYHPINDPYSCVPFPATPAPSQQPQRGPQAQQPTQTPPQAPRSPQQQQRQQQRPQQQQQQPCPTGYKRDPWTLRCVPITPQRQQQQSQQQCATLGTVFDQAVGRCVPVGQAISPLPIPDEAEDLWAKLKELPWWLWVALAGLILLNRDDGGKKTTVTYRRASR